MKGYVFSTTPLPVAIISALVQQCLVIVLSLMILDGGVIAQICLHAFAGFWGGAGLLIVRRGAAMNRLDLALIRFGFIPVCIMSFFLSHWIWGLRGY